MKYLPLGLIAAVLLLSACQTESVPTDEDALATLLERAASLELDTPYEPPPGDPLHHHTAGFATTLCAGIFVTGLDPDFAAESIGYFTSPHEHRKHVTARDIDYEKKTVSLTLPDGEVITSMYNGDHGCVALPAGEDKPFFEAPAIASKLGDPSQEAWPMGDVLPTGPFPAELDMSKVAAAVDAAFEQPDGLTAAFVVSHKGRIIGERYGDGIDLHTSLESWSMGKSMSATLLGTLIQDGVYELWQPAPIPEWQGPDDPRAEIRIGDILQMSSGLRIKAPLDPDYDPEGTYPDHVYYYTGRVNSFEYAATRPLQWKPGTVGRYRNTDPVLTNYLIRLAVEKQGKPYHQFPTDALFDKLGMRDMILQTDPYGNILLQGYELGSARDWIRMGNLYLQDGVWNGERILPEGFAEFVSTLAPGWKADNRPIYGGMFWLNGDETFPIPKEAYYMAGAGGQFTIMIPSKDLVVVRLGHYKGSGPGGEDLRKALGLLMEAAG